MLGEQPLQVRLDAVLDQAGVDAELVGGVVQHLVDEDPEPVLGLGVLHLPDGRDPVRGLVLLGGDLGHGARRGHPVERLVRAAVAVDQHRAVRLDQQQPGRQGEVGGEPPVVVHRALRNHQAHEASLYGTRPHCIGPLAGAHSKSRGESTCRMSWATWPGSLWSSPRRVAGALADHRPAAPPPATAASTGRRRWLDARRPPSPPMPPILLALELSRLASHVRYVEESDLPRKAERLMAARLAYDHALRDYCRAVDIPVPTAIRGLSREQRFDMEAALIGAGHEW